MIQLIGEELITPKILLFNKIYENDKLIYCLSSTIGVDSVLYFWKFEYDENDKLITTFRYNFSNNIIIKYNYEYEENKTICSWFENHRNRQRIFNTNNDKIVSYENFEIVYENENIIEINEVKQNENISVPVYKFEYEDDEIYTAQYYEHSELKIEYVFEFDGSNLSNLLITNYNDYLEYYKQYNYDRNNLLKNISLQYIEGTTHKQFYIDYKKKEIYRSGVRYQSGYQECQHTYTMENGVLKTITSNDTTREYELDE